MKKLVIINLTDSSGLCYTFDVYPINTQFNEISVVYALIHVNYSDKLTYKIFYIGSTNNLHERLKNHHKLKECIEKGVNCIGINIDRSEFSRAVKERDLIRAYAPTENELLRN